MTIHRISKRGKQDAADDSASHTCVRRLSRSVSSATPGVLPGVAQDLSASDFEGWLFEFRRSIVRVSKGFPPFEGVEPSSPGDHVSIFERRLPILERRASRSFGFRPFRIRRPPRSARSRAWRARSGPEYARHRKRGLTSGRDATREAARAPASAERPGRGRRGSGQRPTMARPSLFDLSSRPAELRTSAMRRLEGRHGDGTASDMRSKE